MEEKYRKKTKLADVEFSDIYALCESILQLHPKTTFFQETYPERMKEESRLREWIPRNILNFLEDRRNIYEKDKSNIFIYPFGRFKNLGQIVKDKYNILTFGNFFDRGGIENLKCHYDINVSQLLYRGFRDNDVNQAKMAVRYICRLFQRNSIRLAIIGNDTTFKERAIAIACHEIGIPVVALQHGLYTRESIRKEPIGRYSNAFWCWSRFIKEEYEKCHPTMKGFVRVVGYPHKMVDRNISTPDTVLFACVAYKEFESIVVDPYMEMIKTVYMACADLRLKLRLRLHPGECKELYERYLGNRQGLSISRETDLMNDIADSALVMGDVSSVLLEAGLAHRKAISIIWNDKVKEMVKDPAYLTVVKVENRLEDIIKSIEDNIGVYDNNGLVDYYAGERDVFKERVIFEISKWVAQ